MTSESQVWQIQKGDLVRFSQTPNSFHTPVGMWKSVFDDKQYVELPDTFTILVFDTREAWSDSGDRFHIAGLCLEVDSVITLWHAHHLNAQILQKATK